jgi:hypothetical protein
MIAATDTQPVAGTLPFLLVSPQPPRWPAGSPTSVLGRTAKGSASDVIGCQ